MAQSIIECILVIISLLALVSSQDSSNQCTSLIDCPACYKSRGSCTWCGDEDFNDQDKSKPRCDDSSNFPTCKNTSQFPTTAMKGSDKCSNRGFFACGRCFCFPGRSGDTCSCDESKASCRANLSNLSEPLCSGMGNCVCGECECNKRQNPQELIFGSLCECDNFSCPKHQGLICGGPGHGRCECGKCACEGSWTGDTCGVRNCTDTEPQCMHNGILCDGHGSCDCGLCICDAGYNGSKCEDCSTCAQCSATKDCIICQAFNKGDPKICANCNLNVEVVNTTIEETCRFQDSDGIFFAFTYDENDAGNITYHVYQNNTNHPAAIPMSDKKSPTLAIVLGIIGGLILLCVIALLLFFKFRSSSNAKNPGYKHAQQENDLEL